MTPSSSLAGTRCMDRWDEGSWDTIPLDLSLIHILRTYEMHRTAEYGIAAHWKYKETNNGNATTTTVTEEELSLIHI